MNKEELKQKLIDIRNGALITPILEEIWESQDPRDKGMNKYRPNKMDKLTEIEKCEHKYTSGGTVVITRFDKMDRRIDQYPSTTIFCEKCGEIKK